MKHFWLIILTFLGSGLSGLVGEEPAFERAPVFYSKSKGNTPLTKIRDRIAAGEDLLSGKSDQDLLLKLLELLEIPVESQVLVFSKTSQQNNWISAQTPRAIYYSDNAYVGWVQRGDIEVATFDENLGMLFHILSISSGQENRDIKFLRKSSCMSCHGSAATGGWPGLTIRSVYTSKSGQPVLRAGTFRTDHSSPIHQRWGGWFVTGNPHGQKHLGNAFAEPGAEGSDIPNHPIYSGAVDTLDGIFSADQYLAGGVSDIVSLMVLEHQVAVHNALVQGNLVTRQTLYKNMVEAFGTAPLSESNQKIIDDQAEKIVAELMFKSEHRMEETGVTGSPAFQKAFLQSARSSQAGLSLKDLRLKERLFEYRCSYLIYSDAFAHLPGELKGLVLDKLSHILIEGRADYAYLTEHERKAIHEILLETLPSFLEYTNG